MSSNHIFATTPDPERVLRAAQRIEYPIRMWYFVGGLVAAFGLAHLLYSLFNTCRPRKTVQELAHHATHQEDQIVWRRLPQAIMTSLRIIAFRYTIPVGRQYAVCVLEAALAAGYLGVILTFGLVNGCP